MTAATDSSAMPDSLWAATAPPAAATPALQESMSTDVAIVGAGFTGLSAALHLAEAGAQCCVLEAREPGWGASGRNGGQVNPALKHDPDDIVRELGSERGERLNDLIHRSADLVFDLIRRHGIACDARRSGWLQLAHTEGALPDLASRANQWRRRGVDTVLLDRREVARRVGSEAFAGGWFDPRAGSVHPLAYTRGLVRAALKLGARIHGNTPVVAIDRAPKGYLLRTAGGAVVRAERVVIATDAYTGALWPGLAQTLIAANSFIVATEPLGALADHILPGGESASNTQRLLLYFRRDAQGRLLMGGRGHFGDARHPGDFAHLERAVRLVFPELRTVRYQHRWAGRVAITRDFLPHVHEPAPGVTIAVGYNGRGVATGTAMGQQIAARLTGGRAMAFPLSEIRPIPLHALQRLYVTLGVAWYSLRDRLA
jgi:glycine/D-amino acid oxidase-like deaminating enzyme